MLPIVNGLTQDYMDKIAFIKLNANEAGKAAFAYYRLLGHIRATSFSSLMACRSGATLGCVPERRSPNNWMPA